MAKTARSVRLPTHVRPTHYAISLTPDLKRFTFEGVEEIMVELSKPAASITLHATDLTILNASVRQGDLASPARVRFDAAAETATLHFSRSIKKGSATLSISFRGILNDNMHGFYRSSYAVRGKTHYLATTQFESTDARRAFPCFDEPAMKAVFDISLNVQRDHEAISNTLPVQTTPLPHNRKLVRFGPTPRMSTYLIAFIVGEFEHLQKKSKAGTLVRVFTTKGKRHQARFALDCAAKTVDFFNKYFDYPYPLPKLDMIAIPDFSAGAMENWGAITYRETALLVDPKRSSTMNKQWVALVIAHEIAHQWFGNLVTMEWWTHLWLNEGFASYIEYLAVDHLFPDWDIWTQFLQSDHGAALHYDGLKHTHPVEVEVHNPAEIASVFDAVSYSKGASIIRMIAAYIGETAFRDGLRYYLKRHSYKNAQTKDLWNALAHASGKPIAKIMARWTGMGGYPLVTVAESGKRLTLRQSRFYSSPLSQQTAREKPLWHIPINYRTDRISGRFMLSKRGGRLAIPPGSWLKLNANESGFYRTSYSAAMRAKLALPLKTKHLNTRDRLGLIRDVHATTESGLLSSVECLSFARLYVHEDQYVVWGAIAGALAKVRSLIADEPMAGPYKRCALSMFTNIRLTMGWDASPRSHSDALLKVLVLESLGAYGDEETIAHARRLFASVSARTNPIQADLRGVVYAINAKYGGIKEHVKLQRMYEEEAMHEEKNRIGRALGAFEKRELLHRTLAFALSRAVRKQDSVRMISVVTHNPKGTQLAWTFMKRHWGTLQQRYAGTRELSYLLEPLGRSADLTLANDVQRFLKAHPTPGTERTVLQVLERIRSNSAWLERDRVQLALFLE